MANALIGIGGAVLGALLAFLGQLILARRDEAKQRRAFATQFMEAVREALDHLAEGGLNRINGAIGRGAYRERFLEDQSKLQKAITTMEVLGVPESALTLARQFGDEHWAFATREATAEPVQRDKLDDAAFQRLGAELLENLKSLSSLSDKFLAAV